MSERSKRPVSERSERPISEPQANAPISEVLHR